MKINLLINCIANLVCICAFSQTSDANRYFKADQLAIRLGFHLGGIAPVSIPSEIREIEGFKPVYPFSLAMEMPFYQINQRLELLSGVTLKSSGMRTRARVENFKGVISLENTPIQNLPGYFTGSIKNNFHNWYLEIPLNIRYKLDNHWKMLGGLYYAQTLSRSFEGGVSNAYIRLGAPTAEKIIIPTASYKTSEYLRKYDIGAKIGGEYSINSSWNVRGMLNYGFINALDAPEENLKVILHPIFFDLSLGYAWPFKK